MSFLWPIRLLCPQSISLDLHPRTYSGGASQSGRTQISVSDAGYWTVQMAGFPVYDRDRVNCWRAIENLLEGRLNTVDIELYNYEYQFSAHGSDVEPSDFLEVSVTHSDDATFSDGSGYASGLVEVELDASAIVRATSITLDITYAPRIEPGQIFSIEGDSKGPRFYKVRTFDADTNEMTFRPPLREAVSAGARVEFDRPRCRMRLASDNAMKLELRAPTIGFPDIALEEAL